jgi:F0F1-type ATP synthase beta subunit
MDSKVFIYIICPIALLDGEGDEYPEAGFYMMGTLEEAFETGRKLTREAGSN